MQVLVRENQGSHIRFQLVCPPAVDTPLIDQAKLNVVWKKVFKSNTPALPDGSGS
jgi:hypothetical protein